MDIEEEDLCQSNVPEDEIADIESMPKIDMINHLIVSVDDSPVKRKDPDTRRRDAMKQLPLVQGINNINRNSLPFPSTI